ncbi:MAG: LacI family DNA-binding transcriptional regulator [Anaerolineales bacterium]|nr:LacI family DNA-binding transcriptional regulator [Anaerolineales bacterium]
MPKARVTIRDVAAQAGVSHQTVSRVINDSERVSPETRARVEAAIQALNYQPNAIAQSMAKGRTGMLACIAPNLTDYTFASLIDGAERAVRQQGYFLLSASAPDAATFAALVAELVPRRRAEGLLVINPYADGRYRHLPPNFPLVFAGARPRQNAANSVSLDDVAAGRRATEHLLGLGHRRIALITGPMAEDCSQDRLAGYEAALQAAGLAIDPGLVVEGTWQARSGYDAFMQLAQAGPLPDAIFAQNDQMAVGVLRAAADHGVNVPQALSVIGVDDVPMAAYFEPPLTTLRQDFARIGHEAARLLMNVIEQPGVPRQDMRIPAELIVRRSTGAV